MSEQREKGFLLSWKSGGKEPFVPKIANQENRTQEKAEANRGSRKLGVIRMIFFPGFVV